ncbi:MAG: class I SAM-dependent methyltransferase [Hydrogenophaga sp.]|uniref:class I SAM-dependent methyltransferase n=1 Tax=Hydrogenophaga intermedia TaxID=65786 RepID=UPI00204386E7|nr:class I SAM-dependent methyltransferase [Hydrogenophaga intermedia]MCM3564381.1 class I SAM-dependent methyltransferase [Hydrogenophaga intermedia]
MNTTTAPRHPAGFTLPRNAPAAARTVLRLLQGLEHGSLTVTLPDGTLQRFGRPEGIHASIRLHNWNVCAAVLKSGDIGFAEGYIAGDWSTPNLVALIEVMLHNRHRVEDVIHGSWLGRLVYRIRHLLNHNSKANSRKNIHAHYDLGNAFYERWLDTTMNYSSAWYETPDLSLEEAQHAKVRRALRLADVQPGSRVLEIGCGWGALAEKAVAEFDASVVGVTLSTEQLAFAKARLQRIGAGERADLRLQDYRDIQDAPFDAICSIEMLEAVGQAYWPTYFETVSRLLKPGGRACIQSIVIADRHFERYLRGTDFIQQYIFPGGCLPSSGAVREQAERAGLEVVDEFAFGADYASTLRQWRERFLHEQEAVLKLGFDTRFLRTWEFYLAYCEAAFAEGSTDVLQFTLRKPA